MGIASPLRTAAFSPLTVLTAIFIHSVGLSVGRDEEE